MPRPKAIDLPGVEGPGVSPVKHKDLDKLGDEFIDLRDQKSKLAEEMTGIQTKIIDKMIEKEIKKYRFSDQEIEIIDGKRKVKVKTVKVDSADGDDE